MNLKKDLLAHLPDKCDFLQAGSDYNQKSILASLYIVCNKLVIQIAIFYKRGLFLWTASDNYDVGRPKAFGDRPRAINK